MGMSPPHTKAEVSISVCHLNSVTLHQRLSSAAHFLLYINSKSVLQVAVWAGSNLCISYRLVWICACVCIFLSVQLFERQPMVLLLETHGKLWLA